MKKLLCAALSLFILFGLCSCSLEPGKVENAEINYGVSEKYTKADMNKAVQVVFDEFKTWFGFELYSISYAGDEACLDEDELDYCNSLREGAEFVDCIIFYSSFLTSPDAYNEGFNSNDVYNGWSWHLAREADGEWQLLTWGY
ncbi:MAG: hypothetical protein IKV49_00790 [Clostridia bacterium]|nr:hypothetical protein [Clostridia bacterium]